MKEGGMLCIRVVALLFALGTLLPGRAWAWDGVTQDQVGGIELYPSGGFHLYLAGHQDLCPVGGWPGHAIVSLDTGATSDGVKSMLAMMMAAKLSGLTITVFANNNPSGGACIVGAIILDWDSR